MIEHRMLYSRERSVSREETVGARSMLERKVKCSPGKKGLF
jgi:hypothetical protein